MPATPRMLEYAELLIEKCGFNLFDYDLENMTFQEVSDLIDELKEHLGYDEQHNSRHARRQY